MKLSVGLGVLAALLSFSAPASAGIVLGADVYGAMPIGDGGDSLKFGYGFNGRLGYMLPVPVVDLSAEVVGGLTRFTYEADLGGGGKIEGDNSFIRAMVGGRVGIGVGVKPFAYWHIGYAHKGGSVGGDDLSGNVLATQFGGGLDFTALPLVTVGIQAGYSYLGSSSDETSAGGTTVTTDFPAAKWIELGAHASIGF